MKLVLANKNPNFYESNQDKYSYIKVNRNEGNIDDNVSINKKQFLDTLFPDSTNFKDTFLFSQTSIFNYSITFNSQNFPPNTYPDTFEFYNNVSYLKFVFNDFELYFFVQNRQCLRYNLNEWTYTLRLDAYNSYWDKFYESFKSKYLTREILVTRWLAPRFTLKDNTKLIFSFLSQQNEFWNNEKFIESINSLITIYSNNSIALWDEYKISGTTIIPQAKLLDSIYANRDEGTTPKDKTLFLKIDNSFVYNFINTKALKGGTGHLPAQNMLSKLYGVTNVYYVVPLINDLRTKPVGGEPQITPDDHDFSDNFYNTIIGKSILANVYDVIEVIDAYLTAVVCIPKPIVPLFGNGLKWNDFTYPIRTRDNFASNNDKLYAQNDKFKDYSCAEIDFSIVSSQTAHGFVVSSYQDFNAAPNGYIRPYNEPSPLYNKIDSVTNSMCDERLPVELLNKYLINDITNQKIIQKRNILFEPHLFDEKIFNVKYGFYTGENISISPKMYFYNNLIDLETYKSIFILGYQFVQPQICILTMGVVSGLYKDKNRNGENNLTKQFSPQLQFSVDKEDAFLASNRYSMNTGLNTNIAKGILGMAGSGIGTYIGANILGSSFNQNTNMSKFMNQMRGIETAGIFSLVNQGVGIASSAAQYESTLRDLYNSPNQVQGLENSYNNLTTSSPIYSINWINDNDKEKIANYFNMQGYFCNKLKQITSLATRLYFDYWEIPNIKSLINNDLIPLEIIEYFDKLFHNGIRLWHFDINGQNADLGNYDNENWELELLPNFLKEYSIISTHNDITAQPTNFQSEKKLKFISSKGDIKYGN